MAGFSKSIQERFNKPWRPMVQSGLGKKISKKRFPEKQDTYCPTKFKKSKAQNKVSQIDF